MRTPDALRAVRWSTGTRTVADSSTAAPPTKESGGLTGAVVGKAEKALDNVLDASVGYSLAFLFALAAGVLLWLYIKAQEKHRKSLEDQIAKQEKDAEDREKEMRATVAIIERADASNRALKDTSDQRVAAMNEVATAVRLVGESQRAIVERNKDTITRYDRHFEVIIDLVRENQRRIDAVEQATRDLSRTRG